MRRKTALWSGFVAGVIVTVVTYVAGAMLMSVGWMFWDVISNGYNRLATVGRDMILLLVISLAYAVTLFSPAMIFGGFAGVILYQMARKV